ncbi:CotY/CotZ family spore coat protein [Peribacillus deserti]|uniref:Spore coat protein n=1 Tax=Peribacillus deserti TaxID=673318 RepID=A0A2N5M2A1_9BACI|nr:CotY/CotZ family spore coat protein [Peribacillus deserti]PLT28504.1 spore coat protein [Peribacillus deserti]
MSCGSNFETTNCVCDTLLAIVEAQDQVNPEAVATCTTSCNKSIIELLGGGARNGASAFNTIPVMITSKSTGLPFLGIGFRREPKFKGSHYTQLVSFETTVFRAVDVDAGNCCAVLELLTTPCLIDDRKHLAKKDSLVGKIQTIVGDIDEPLLSTGICITVDLSCFCSVTCLPATTVIKADAITTEHHHDHDFSESSDQHEE